MNIPLENEQLAKEEATAMKGLLKCTHKFISGDKNSSLNDNKWKIIMEIISERFLFPLNAAMGDFVVNKLPFKMVSLP